MSPIASSCWITANRSLKGHPKKFRITKKSSKHTWATPNWLRGCYRRTRHDNFGNQRHFLRLWGSTDPVGFQSEVGERQIDLSGRRQRCREDYPAADCDGIDTPLERYRRLRGPGCQPLASIYQS